MLGFDGKSGLVTGAGLGIGRACAIALAERGAAVAVLDRNADQARATVAAIQDSGGHALAIPVDVSDEPMVRRAVAESAEAFGGLDFAVNNAGIQGQTEMLHELMSDEWQQILSVNLCGVFHSMKYELPEMMTKGGGAIVNVASVAGLAAIPHAPAYVASKHGVVGLTRAAARDYGKYGIRVNALCPGGTVTPMYVAKYPDHRERPANNALGRIGTPEEIAAAAVWLCSDDASYASGEAIRIDGCHS